MEARLYAEDPAKGFLPSIGAARALRTWATNRDVGPRIETGVETGDSVTPFYDPMIAKVIAHGPDRIAAIDALASALSQTFVWPVRTNAGFLVRALLDDDFRAARLSTAFIPGKGDALLPPPTPSASGLAAAAQEIFRWTPGLSFQPDEWVGWRLNAPSERQVRVAVNGNEAWTEPREDPDAGLRSFGSEALLNEQGQTFLVSHFRASGDSGVSASDGAIISPMPGKLIAVEVRQGEAVTKGQKLVTLEAMKMEHSLTAPFDGIVAELNAREGAQVSEGALLVRIEKGEG